MEFFIVTFQSISTGVSALADWAFVFLVAQVDRHVSLQVIPPEACTAQTLRTVLCRSNPHADQPPSVCTACVMVGSKMIS